MSKTNLLVIEVMGGVVDAVFSNEPVQVVLVDWDNIQDGGKAGAIDLQPLSALSAETQQAIAMGDQGWLKVKAPKPKLSDLARKSYLGDSVYAAIDEAGALVLTTENGDGPSNTIVLEDSVYAALLRYIEDERARGALS